jgi:2,4-dienoyl-CoA reductase (NADPH2)
VTLLQRKTSPIGAGLAKTTGWAHRRVLQQFGVREVRGATYERISRDDGGLALDYHVDGRRERLSIDTVVLCTGQESVRDLLGPGGDPQWHVIGGADVAAELDAERAIAQGTAVALAV